MEKEGRFHPDNMLPNGKIMKLLRNARNETKF